MESDYYYIYGITFDDLYEYIKFTSKYLLDNSENYEDFKKKIYPFAKIYDDVTIKDKIEKLQCELSFEKIYNIKKKTFKELCELNITFGEFMRCEKILENMPCEDLDKINKYIQGYQLFLDTKKMFEEKNIDGMSDILINIYKNISDYKIKKFRKIFPLYTYKYKNIIYYGVKHSGRNEEDNIHEKDNNKLEKYHGKLQYDVYQFRYK